MRVEIRLERSMEVDVWERLGLKMFDPIVFIQSLKLRFQLTVIGKPEATFKKCGPLPKLKPRFKHATTN